MDIRLTKDEDKEHFEEAWKASDYVRKKLCAVLMKEVQSNMKSREVDFDNTAWPFKQAYKNGMVEGLRYAVRLMEGKDDIVW